jgi:hypothetical protein
MSVGLAGVAQPVARTSSTQPTDDRLACEAMGQWVQAAGRSGPADFLAISGANRRPNIAA